MKDFPLPQLIGLHGAPGAGKTTIAAHLCDSREFRSYAFGDPLRQALYTLDPLLSSQGSLRALVDDGGWAAALTDRIHGPEVNRLLATLRTDVAREVFAPDLWVRRLQGSISSDAELLGVCAVVVTDVTTAEEAAWVLSRGGEVWRVDRPGRTVHAQLPDRLISAVINNDATLRALTRRVDRAMAACPHRDDAPVA